MKKTILVYCSFFTFLSSPTVQAAQEPEHVWLDPHKVPELPHYPNRKADIAETVIRYLTDPEQIP